MKELRVIVAGTREFYNYEVLKTKCDVTIAKELSIHKDCERVCIISGRAIGPDQMGERYAEERGYHVYLFPAMWNTYGQRAGYIRNAEMGDFAGKEGNVGILIAFWDGESKGTKHMIDYAEKKGLAVYIHQEPIVKPWSDQFMDHVTVGK